MQSSPSACTQQCVVLTSACRFVGQPHGEGIVLDQEDPFWCQALEDLETCGQSELLREIEVRRW